MKTLREHFWAGYEQFSLAERLLLIVLALVLITVWLVKPPDPPAYKWRLPLHRHTLNYYMKK